MELFRLERLVGGFPRNRFDHVMQYLHFTNSKSPQASVDRGWKVRSVVTTLKKTFALGYNVGPVIAFDEAIIPTRSRQNSTRQYLPQKPHKWGTKFFVACCGETAYRMRCVCCTELTFFYGELRLAGFVLAKFVMLEVANISIVINRISNIESSYV